MTRRADKRGFGVIAITGALVVAGPVVVDAHEGDTARYILAGELVGGLAYPGPGPEEASSSMRLTVTPSDKVLCFELEWKAMDTPTGMTIRIGWPADGSANEAFDEIAIEISDDDVLEEGDEEGTAIGCAEAEHDPLDSFANEPGDSHVTVTTARHPDGAAGGRLSLERISGGGSEEEEEEEPLLGQEELVESGGVSRFVPNVLATLLVVGMTVAGVVTWRRGFGIDQSPPPSGVALAASSYTVLLLGWLAMVFDRTLAPLSLDGTREVSDVRQLTVVGLWLALISLLTAIVGFSTSRDHPPLRRIAVLLGLAALLMAVLWLGWNVVQPTYET